MLNDDFFVGASTQLLRVTPCLTAKLKDPWEPTGTGVCLAPDSETWVHILSGVPGVE